MRVGANPRGNVSLFAGRFGLYFRERLGRIAGAGPGIVLAVAVVAILAALALLVLIVR